MAGIVTNGLFDHRYRDIGRLERSGWCWFGSIFGHHGNFVRLSILLSLLVRLGAGNFSIGGFVVDQFYSCLGDR